MNKRCDNFKYTRIKEKTFRLYKCGQLKGEDTVVYCEKSCYEVSV